MPGEVTVGLTMRHRLQWFIHLRADGLRKGDGQPVYTPSEYGTLFPTFTTTIRLHNDGAGRINEATLNVELARLIYRPFTCGYAVLLCNWKKALDRGRTDRISLTHDLDLEL